MEWPFLASKQQSTAEVYSIIQLSSRKANGRGRHLVSIGTELVVV